MRAEYSACREVIKNLFCVQNILHPEQKSGVPVLAVYKDKTKMRWIRHRTIILVNAMIYFNCIIAIATTIRDTTTTIQVSHPHSHSSSSTTTDYYTAFFIGIPPLWPQLMLLLLYCAIKLHQLIGHCLSGLSHHLLQFTSLCKPKN